MLSITKLQNLKAIHNLRGSSYYGLLLLSITKLQNLKAIHNWYCYIHYCLFCCYQSQNYKIWKQFTISNKQHLWSNMLLSITKLQNLKAIHNCGFLRAFGRRVVINHKTTKFESYSQRGKTTIKSKYSCYQSQNYKIWKQFTTILQSEAPNTMLLSITKLQNLKAIHNYRLFLKRLYRLLSITKLQNLKAIHNTRYIRSLFWGVVINHKTTKFESNSQQEYRHFVSPSCCYQSQNYKIWKQFTTKS